MLDIIVSIILGYLLGSIPWALIIGLIFFNKDIRNYGSGNLGGSNAGRVLGKKIGLLVIALDALKAFFVVMFAATILKNPTAASVAGIFACIGHCYPLFAKFKGGKGVATILGFNLALTLFVTGEFLVLFLAPALIFIITICLTKIVSLSSMLWLLSVCYFNYLVNGLELTTIILIMLWIFVVYRHKENIIKIINKKENKVSWIK